MCQYYCVPFYKVAIIQDKYTISGQRLAIFVCFQIALVNMSKYICRGGASVLFLIWAMSSYLQT